MNAVIDRDAQLEREIDAAYERMIAAKNDAEAREHFREMALLIRRRSPERVQRMELDRRIAIRGQKTK